MSEAQTYGNSLTLGTMLHEYRLDAVLGAGGFGMTYLAWDVNLEKRVAIKEYMPAELAIRALDGSIVPVNTKSEYNYKWGLERFVQEARTLARFSHPNIMRVHRFFDANNTGYMVMDYEAGESFYQYLKRSPAPPEAWLKQVLMPILDGLEAVHNSGFLHRDIKPSNVFIRENGTAVLLDFGSARLAGGGASNNLAAIITPGYAPPEQYSVDGNQGPWSDIYALSGVMYRAVTGENPPDAVKRMREDKVADTLAVVRGRYDERFLRAIEWGMKLEARVRPKGVEEWRELFSGRDPVTALNSGGGLIADGRRADTATAVTVATPRGMRRRRKWIHRGVLLCLVLAAAVFYLKHRSLEKSLPQAATEQPASPFAPELERYVMQRFEAADTDRSGAISRAELEQQLPAYAGRFSQIDSNGDGMVSLRELMAFMQTEGIADELTDSRPKNGAPDKVAPPAGGAESAPAPAGAGSDVIVPQSLR